MPDRVLQAILAMDAYNRGTGAGTVLDAADTKLGFATIRDTADDAADEAVGFFAVSYDVSQAPGMNELSTVISFRGTDNFGLGWDFFNADIWNGWSAGIGFLSQQVNRAISFYQEVVGETEVAGTDLRLANIGLTGHSLGGALAGIVGGLYSRPAMLFDNMPFEAALNTLHQHAMANDFPGIKDFVFGAGSAGWGTSLNGINGYATEYEPVGAIRFFGVGAGAQFDPVVQPLYDSPLAWSPIDLHSQSLLVTLLFGEDRGTAAWKVAAPYVLEHTKSDDIASAIGFSSAGVGGTDAAGDKMATAIAYSALDISSNSSDGGLVFGDSAIRALFDDSDDLGYTLVRVSGDPNGVSRAFDNTVCEMIGSIICNYAGVLALKEVRRDASPTAINGVLEFSADYGSLSVDLSRETWKISGQQFEILNEEILLEGALIGGMSAEEMVDSALWYYNVTGAADSSLSYLVESLTFDLNGAQNEVAGFWSDHGLNVVLTRHSDGGFAATSSQDFMVLGSDADESIFGKDGNDILFGGDGVDHLMGHLGADLIYGGSGDDVVDGTDDIDGDKVYGGDGADTITGGEGWDELYGDAGDDIIDAGLGDNYVWGGAGNDAISAGQGDNTLYGDDGNDTIYGGEGRSFIYGGAGDDYLTTDAAYGEIYGDEGDDTLVGDGPDIILDGGAGEDTIYGEQGASIVGGADDDTIYSVGGGWIEGGSGSDDISVTGFSNGLVITAGTGNDNLFLDGNISLLEYNFSSGDGRDIIGNTSVFNDSAIFTLLSDLEWYDSSLTIHLDSAEFLHGDPDDSFWSLTLDLEFELGSDSIRVENVTADAMTYSNGPFSESMLHSLTLIGFGFGNGVTTTDVYAGGLSVFQGSVDWV